MMAILGKLKSLTLLELILDAGLLFLFCLQTIIASCLLTFGAIPIPASWANGILKNYSSPDLRFEADRYSISTYGAIKLAGIRIYDSTIDSPIIEADSAEVQLHFSLQKKPFIEIKDVVVTDGAVYLPAVYAPSGQRTAALDAISFELIPQAGRVVVHSFAARHDNIYVRGAIDLPLSSLGSLDQTTAGKDPNIPRNIFRLLSQAIKQKQRYNVLHHPTFFVRVKADRNDAINIDLSLSSRALKHNELTGENFRVDGSVRYESGALSITEPIQTSADLIEIPRFEVSLRDVAGQLEPDQWNQLLSGKLPSFKLAAQSIQDSQHELKASLLKINLTEYPIVRMKGSTRGLDGAVDLNGFINLERQSGDLSASGSVDLLKIIPAKIAVRMPTIEYNSPPYYSLDVRLGEGYQIDSANLSMQAHEFSVGGILFDKLRAKGRVEGGRLDFDDILLEREEQWLDLDLMIDSESRDYAVGLIASAIPTDYNVLLPRWWSAIFKDFEFSNQTDGTGDFIIYGNGHSPVSDLVYGTANARNLSYRGVMLDSGEVRVRGRQRYYEVDLANLKSGHGAAKGRLQFTSIDDGIRAPVSIRYDFDARLSIEAAINLLGPGAAAETIAAFNTTSLPALKLKGAFFSKMYPQYRAFAYFDLHAEVETALFFKETPLDYLRFDLFSRNSRLALRDTFFGYADGQGRLKADITDSHQINFQLILDDADKAQAIRDLPQLDSVEEDLGVELERPENLEDREEARADFRLNAQGPMNDPYQFNGFGYFQIRDNKLASVQLLGPFSKLLENTPLSFTSLNLDQMSSRFVLEENLLSFDDFQINGPQTRIRGNGTMQLREQSLDMRISVAPFGNAGSPESTLRKMTDIIPLSKLLEFRLTGTLEKQNWRSLYDPRNIIPGI